MNNVIKRLFSLSCLAAATAIPGLSAAEPAIIAKARAYLGSESALKSITTLHYVGQLEIEGADNQEAITVEILFKSPYRQRSTIQSGRGSEITVLNDYDGWQRIEAADDETRWTLTLLKVEQIKNLRANVWENLNFFRGLENQGGEIKDLGTVTIDGLTTRKLAFVHSSEVTFYRYFDEATGRLVLTETIRGEKIREEGTMVVNGVKFPKTLITITPREDGTDQTIKINFSRVTVNEAIDQSQFEMPVLTSK